MSGSNESRNAMRQQDVEVLIGIVATVTGRLYAGQLDTDTTRKFAERFVNAGLLSPEPGGNLPSAGKVRLALEDLVQRLRYAYGDYEIEPTPEPYMTAHVLELPSEAVAVECQGDLPAGQVRDPLVRYENGGGWLLFAHYPELPPDQDFNERMADLRQTVERHGGRYTGHQGPPR